MTAYTVIVEGPDSFRDTVTVAGFNSGDAKARAIWHVVYRDHRDFDSLRAVSCVAAVAALTDDGFGDAA